MNLTTLTPYLLQQFKSEQELVKNIKLLSHNFTKDRTQINDYHEDEKMISAYAAFYLTTNYPKFSYCMEYLKAYKDLFTEYEIIDIGAGPGTFVFAIGDYYNWSMDSVIWGVETSPLMRKQANKIKEGLYADKSIEFVAGTKSIPNKTKKRLIIFTHSFNEMTKADAHKYIRDLDADLVMFIEPGTQELFKSYLPMRNELIEKGFNCLYPCPSNAKCPMEKTEDWCHQYIRVSHDLEVQRLTQITQKNRTWMPLTLGLYSKEYTKEENSFFGRIIRTFPETKFSFIWQLCSHKNKLDFVEVLKRNFSKKETKVIGEYFAGEEVVFEIEKELKDNRLRIKLKD